MFIFSIQEPVHILYISFHAIYKIGYIAYNAMATLPTTQTHIGVIYRLIFFLFHFLLSLFFFGDGDTVEMLAPAFSDIAGMFSELA